VRSTGHYWDMKHSLPLSRRGALGLGLGALTIPFAQHRAQAAAPALVLVELFTSQGCSSCPAADKLAGELSRDPNNIVVSFNVDYWDYLGWRDTLAKPEYSQRQYDYAKSRGDGQVYTPQMIINGGEHASGSNVTNLIAGARKHAPAINLTLEVTKKEIKVDIPGQAFDGEATLWLMAIAPAIQQKIERGENSGLSITYHNSVRNLVPAAMWKGGAYSGSWMRDAVIPADCKSCVAVLQRERTGVVLGLARA
jgi:hypothetical protein